jgi:hypothetical protein
MNEDLLAKEIGCGSVAEMLVVIVVAEKRRQAGEVQQWWTTAEDSDIHSWKPSSFPPHVKYLNDQSSTHRYKPFSPQILTSTQASSQWLDSFGPSERS